MSDRVTAQQVADLAGVSQSAVSRVFTPGASASAKTSAKVRKAAAELGYRPNVLARAMVSGRSRMIGIVVAYLENHFYPEALEKLSNALQARGYHALIFMASQTAGNIDQVMEEILDYQVDGLIIASVALSSDIASRCQAAGVPVVLFNRSQDTDGLTSVTSDNYAGAYKVAEFLRAAGHQRVGYIAGWEGASTQRDREAGFRDGLAAQGGTLARRTCGDFHREATLRAAHEMFDVSPQDRPDAVFVANDHMALIVMDYLRHEANLRVPHDVSVVGYDDAPPAAWLSYQLTTVRQRANRMVSETLRVLFERIDAEQEAPPRSIQIDAPLIVRASARIPQGWKS